MAKKAQRLVVSYGVDQGENYEGNETDVIIKVLDATDKMIAHRIYDTDELEGDNRVRMLGYGVNKLLTDRTSDEKNKLQKLVDMDEVWELILTGEWRKERTVGAQVVGVEVEALAELKGWKIPQTQKALATYTKEVRAKILANPAVTAIAERIKGERAEAAAADELEGSLDDLTTE